MSTGLLIVGFAVLGGMCTGWLMYPIGRYFIAKADRTFAEADSLRAQTAAWAYRAKTKDIHSIPADDGSGYV